MTKSETLNQDPDFSLVVGGPLFQLYRRAYLSGDSLELVQRRVVLITAIAWLPPLVLSMIDGHAMSGTIALPFLHDIETHVRFLVALPILIFAELFVHSRLRIAVKSFLERHIIFPEDIPKFHGAISGTLRLRNSSLVEVTIVLMIYTLGLWIWRSQVATDAASWYGLRDLSGWHLTRAGYWYAFVSIPIFQFLLVRWYFRFFLWFQFLWRVSKLNLRLIATNPDRAAGLGFLGASTYAFGPILFAQGALLAGLIANRVLYLGENLMSFKVEAAGLLAFIVVFVLSPLIVFTPQLARTKREGLRDYGKLVTNYVQGFEEKWIGSRTSSKEELLGSGDIQSLADLGNSFAVVKEMRLTAFGLKDLTRLAMITAAPLLPLTLTVFSVEEVVTRLIKMLF
jgi:hypothetical protein